MQLLVGQNFEIRLHSFFISNLLGWGVQTSLTKITPTLLNLTFLGSGIEFKKI